MKKYIDADKLIESLKFMEKNREIFDQGTILAVVAAIEVLHTADVAPRAEVVKECVDALAPLIDTLCRATGIEVSYFGEWANQLKSGEEHHENSILP